MFCWKLVNPRSYVAKTVTSFCWFSVSVRLAFFRAMVSDRSSGLAAIAAPTGIVASRTAEPGSPAWGSSLQAGPNTSVGFVTPFGEAPGAGAAAGVDVAGSSLGIGAGVPHAASATVSAAALTTVPTNLRRWIFLTCLFLLERPVAPDSKSRLPQPGRRHPNTVGHGPHTDRHRGEASAGASSRDFRAARHVSGPAQPRCARPHR